PLPAYDEARRPSAVAEVSFLVHTHVLEDARALCGAWTERARALSARLSTVSGVGPRLARALLSGLPPEVLLGALAAGDVARLTRIPGVGKKTAERLVLELREKAAELAAAPAATSAALEPDDEDILVALVNLGYRRADAEKALADVRHEKAGATVPELLRMSLKRLARL